MSEWTDEWEQKGYIFSNILTIANRLQILGDKMDEQVTLKQWLLIAVILKSGKPVPTITETALMFGSSRQNVKKMVLILQKRGFLELFKDDIDARVLRIRVTPRCLAYFHERDEKEMGFMRALFQNFGQTATWQLYEGLQKLAANIKDMEKMYDEEEGD